MREEELLINRLKAYKDSRIYPFHMPGHKRLQLGGIKGETARSGMDFPNPFFVDITEVEGFDNLHHAQGILKQSMEWAARVYGADRTWYLINGSTCGILASVCGCTRPGGHILMSRNCHKAAYHAAYINHLRTSYVYPQDLPGLGIQGGILPEDVEKALEEHRDIQAVFIVSPTYDGVVSDVSKIADIVHRKGIPLIVDEAHGAHFRFGKWFPDSALDMGADAVIQSVHKTLPSLTQTALLHIKGNYVNSRNIERYLSIFQSSSPSYVFMASIENSIFVMDRMQRERDSVQMKEYEAHLMDLRRRLASMKNLRLVDRDIVGMGGVWDLDVSKIVVSTRGTALSGADLSSILREKYHLEMEMCGADYVTAITTVFDSPEGLQRLGDSLEEIDADITGMPGSREDGPAVYGMRAQARCSLREAMDSPCRPVRLKESEGQISAEFVYLYPPGIPILAPGENIARNILDVIEEYIKKGLPIQGPEDESLETLRVLSGERPIC
ncbi:MAG TPA: aminotransferase class V-fold PLP-dependent enzyme [Candidatus Enterocloster excrementipullorum]|uniref:Aminotransferase class V-fold PLP-dependent enzyme n=1 Tax=Candidatus Enterocloster excrementipullorum TaxID=2838559 RepID=A0A9D2SFR1_9FIRM|nr:aminotransferase class V-fold PLP-dependent enzyme [Candidatus Enterocloster excrementipullorum]